MAGFLPCDKCARFFPYGPGLAGKPAETGPGNAANSTPAPHGAKGRFRKAGMTEPKRIVLIFENGGLREEGLRYSVELARRMECPVSVLMLAERAPDAVHAAWENRLAEAAGRIRTAGVLAGSEMRVGDGASEVLKFLAAGPAPAVVVWGGDHGAVLASRHGSSRHWLSRIAGDLGCSVVLPKARKP